MHVCIGSIFHGTTNNKRGSGSKKASILGMVERKGSVHAEKTDNPNKYEIDKMIGANVDWRKSTLMTDQNSS